MLIVDLVIGAVVLVAILGAMFGGLVWARRSQHEAEAATRRRQAGHADVLDVALVSQAELDEVWKFLQANHRVLAVS
jgi:hypothetical protein